MKYGEKESGRDEDMVRRKENNTKVSREKENR